MHPPGMMNEVKRRGIWFPLRSLVLQLCNRVQHTINLERADNAGVRSFQEQESIMAYNIEDIEGIGPSYAEKLATAEIETTDDLLNLCCNPQGRKNVSEKTGVSETHLLKWSNMADLMRISGVGPQFAELLENAGVDTVKELRNRNHENLAAKVKEINDQKNLAKTAPGATVVAEWVEQAKRLDPKITY
jgi:predicted flap endonuclease-1-like 5' DNA nuclease